MREDQGMGSEDRGVEGWKWHKVLQGQKFKPCLLEQAWQLSCWGSPVGKVGKIALP